MALSSFGSAIAGAGSAALGSVGNFIKNNNAMNPNNAYNTIKTLTNANNQQSLSNARDAMAFGQMSADKAMAFSAQQAQLNRNFQERMSNTSYQRAVRDLKAAGLNPVLAAMNGASTPTGASAQGYATSGSVADVDESGSNALVNILGSMLSYMSSQEVARTNAQTNLAIAERNNSLSRFVAELNSSTSRYVSDNSLRGAYASASAARYSADQSKAAAKYAADNSATMQSSRLAHDIYMADTYPNNLFSAVWPLIDPDIKSDLSGMFTDAYSSGKDWYNGVNDKFMGWMNGKSSRPTSSKKSSWIDK